MEQQRIQLPPPTMMPMGEIEFDDGTKILVPQVTRDRPLWFRLDDAYVLNNTIPELPDHTAVLQWGGRHASSNALQLTDPLWAVVCLRAGLILLAIVAVISILFGTFLLTVAVIA
jgi:hypothetical protein